MKLEYTFNRTEVTFGTDVAPTNVAYLTNDNVFHAPQYGVMSESIRSIALAYDAPAGASDAVVDLYLWDEFTLTWYRFATETIPMGEVHFVSLPNIIDRKDSRAVSRIGVAIVASPDGAAPAGTYHLSLSSSTAQFGTSDSSAALAAIIALLTTIDADTGAIATSTASIDADTGAIATSTASIDAKIENPMPVEGGPPTLTDHSGTRGSDGTTTTYLTMDPNNRWSMGFIPSTPDGSTVTLSMGQSNENTGNPATATYNDVTDKFFGVAGFDTLGWIEPELPTACVYVEINVTVSGWTGAPADPSWVLFVNQRGNI